MVCFDLVVARGADDCVLAELSETLSPVLLLVENQLAGVAPTLLVIGIVAVLNEPKWRPQVVEQMPTDGSYFRGTVLRTFDGCCHGA